MDNSFCTQENLIEHERGGVLSYKDIKSNDIMNNRVIILKDWMYEVSRSFKLTLNSLHVGFNIVDAYISRTENMTRAKIQLIGCSALFLAGKYNEVNPPTVDQYELAVNNMFMSVYTSAQIVEMEAKLFILIGCNVNIPAEINYVKLMNQLSGTGKCVSGAVGDLTTLVLCYGTRFLPSVLVTAIQKIISPKYEDYQNVFGIDESVVNVCMSDILAIFQRCMKAKTSGIKYLRDFNIDVLSYILRATSPVLDDVLLDDVDLDTYLKNYYFVDKIELTLLDPTTAKQKKAKFLGEGTYGVVKKIDYNSTSYAVKTIANLYPEDGLSGSFIRELSTTLSLNHVNIIKPRYITWDLSSMFIDLGIDDLHDWRKKIHTIDAPIQLAFAEQMFSALKYLHQSGCLHRDIKTKNIIVYQTSTGPRFVLADFGLARGCQIPLKDNSFTHNVVTLWYRPPELLLGKEDYGPQVDVWSIGCVLYEFATGVPLFPGDSEIEQIMKIFHVMGTPVSTTWKGVELLPHYTYKFPKWAAKTHFFQDNKRLSVLYKKLVIECLAMDPQKRPSAVELYDGIVTRYVKRAFANI